MFLIHSTEAAIISWVIGFLLGAIFGVVIVHRPFWLQVKKRLDAHEKTQNKIADRLDTTTPGGLSEVVEVLKTTDRGQE